MKLYLFFYFYNHGQKSWDKLTFVAFFHMHQTNSSTLVQPLPLPPLLQCWTRVHAIFPEFQHCIGGWGEGATHFKTDNSAFFKTSVLKVPKINAITQVSQGILSTIVGWNKLT